MDDGDVVRRVWRQALAAVGLDATDFVETATRRYHALRRAEASAFADARPCLARLAPAYRLGVVTNGLAVDQVPKLAAAGLAEYFEVVVTTDGGCGKPGGRPRRPAETAVYVGDSLAWDVAGARRAGLGAIWLNRGDRDRADDDPRPHREIATLADLPAALLDLARDGEPAS